jgi:hypothetical protein
VRLEECLERVSQTIDRIAMQCLLSMTVIEIMFRRRFQSLSVTNALFLIYVPTGRSTRTLQAWRLGLRYAVDIAVLPSFSEISRCQ